MNYLAHLALSHFNSEVMLGNFIGDSVKGHDYERFSPSMRRGILLHRRIDSFTDMSPYVRDSAALFRDAYGHYSRIICDMVFDHFLASGWDSIHPSLPLSSFVWRVHKVLLLNYFRLPGEMRGILPFLIKSRRLESYATVDGFGKALDVMARNTSLPDYSKAAVFVLQSNYVFLRSCFESFYPLVSSMVDDFLSDISSDYPSAALTMRSRPQ